MKSIPVFLLLLFGIFTVIGFNEALADCTSPHCYAEWVNGGGSTAKGIKTDMQVSDIYAFPDNECKNEMMVESIWMEFPLDTSSQEPQWIEIGATTGGFTEGNSTSKVCLTNIQGYMASSDANRVSGPIYQEFKLNRQLDAGDTVSLEILESYRDSNNVNYQPRLTDAGKTFFSESPGWNAKKISPNNFKVGIESTVEPTEQYSPVPQVKFTNTQVDKGAGYVNFQTPGTNDAKVNVTQGYQRHVCSDGSMIAGTVTSLDCNLIPGKNQRPTIKNSVEVINVDTFKPDINKMTLSANDTDNEYVFFSVSSSSTHQGTVQATIQPQGYILPQSPTTAEFRFVPVANVTNDIVTFDVSDGRVGHTRQIEYHFVQSASKLPEAIDDLSASLSGNQVTLTWSQPSSSSEFKDVEINRRINGGSWRQGCASTESSETSCTLSVANGFTYEYKIRIKNVDGWSEWSNVVIVYVPDTTPPSITWVSPSNGETVSSDSVTVSVKAYDVDSGVSRIMISLDGQTAIQASGPNRWTWTWTFNGLSDGSHTLSITAYNGDGYSYTLSTITFTVQTLDTTPPTLTVPADKTFEATANPTSLTLSQIGNATATDDTDSAPVITNNSTGTFDLGDTSILWTATDSSNNTASGTQVITIQDTTAPTITLLGSSTVTLTLGNTYADAGATASDIYDGDLTSQINKTSNLINTVAGNYTISYDVKDSSGNAADTVARTINVVVDTTPSYTKPSTPTNISTTPGDSQVFLSWNAPADDGGQSIARYIIDHKIAGAQGQWFKTYVSGTMTNGTVTGLDNGKPYYFRVTATNGAFDGPASGILTSVPNTNGLVITKPSTPTNISTTPGDSQVFLSWNAPADDGGQSIARYIIDHKIAGAQGQWFKTYVSGTMTNGTVTGLDNGKPYYFRVTATNGAFDGPASGILTSVPNTNGLVITKPSTPTNISTTPGDSQVFLSWNAPADDGGQSIARYIIDHKIAGAQGQWFKTYVSGTMTNGTVTGLDNGKPYYFRVTATNGAFSSVSSGILTDTPQ